MKKIILITGAMVFGLSCTYAQEVKPSIEDFKNGKSDTEVVLIKTNEISTVINKTLSEDYKRPKNRTVYLDNYSHSYVVYDKRKKKTYIYKKNSPMILELHRSKGNDVKTSTIATK